MLCAKGDAPHPIGRNLVLKPRRHSHDPAIGALFVHLLRRQLRTFTPAERAYRGRFGMSITFAVLIGVGATRW